MLSKAAAVQSSTALQQQLCATPCHVKECSAEQGRAGTLETQGGRGYALDAEVFQRVNNMLTRFFLAMRKMQ